MKFEFDLNEDDYLKFNISNMNNSNTLRKNLLIHKYSVPICWIILTFLWGEISSVPALIWLITFGFISIIWICCFRKYAEFKTTWYSKRELKNKNGGLYIGRRTVEINNDQLYTTSEYIQNSVNLRDTEKIIVEKEYVYVYISQISAIIIPLRIFKDNKEKDVFVDYMYNINLQNT